jgi:hypothetical protein
MRTLLIVALAGSGAFAGEVQDRVRAWVEKTLREEAANREFGIGEVTETAVEAPEAARVAAIARWFTVEVDGRNCSLGPERVIARGERIERWTRTTEQLAALLLEAGLRATDADSMRAAVAALQTLPGGSGFDPRRLEVEAGEARYHVHRLSGGPSCGWAGWWVGDVAYGFTESGRLENVRAEELMLDFSECRAIRDSKDPWLCDEIDWDDEVAKMYEGRWEKEWPADLEAKVKEAIGAELAARKPAMIIKEIAELEVGLPGARVFRCVAKDSHGVNGSYDLVVAHRSGSIERWRGTAEQRRRLLVQAGVLARGEAGLTKAAEILVGFPDDHCQPKSTPAFDAARVEVAGRSLVYHHHRLTLLSGRVGEYLEDEIFEFDAAGFFTVSRTTGIPDLSVEDRDAILREADPWLQLGGFVSDDTRRDVKERQEKREKGEPRHGVKK